jgi:hypothetical protein
MGKCPRKINKGRQIYGNTYLFSGGNAAKQKYWGEGAAGRGVKGRNHFPNISSRF